MSPSSPIDAHEIGWAELIAAFLDEKERAGRPATRTVYARLLRRFVRDAAKPLDEVTPLDIHRFAFGVGCPPGEIPSASTINLRLAAVGGFFAFAQRMGCLERDPAAALPRARVRPSAPRGLSISEVHRLLDVIPSTPSGLRDRALVLVALVSGLRRAELVNLTVHSLADDGSLLCAVQSKGGHQRLRHLPPSLVQLIAGGTQSDPRSAFAPGRRLFAIADSTLYAHLRRYGEAAGLGSVSPHVLRHTAAKLRRQAGATIEEVSSLLGHTSIATTAIYLRRLEDEPDRGGERVAQALGIAGLLSGWRTGATAGSGGRSQPASERRSSWSDSRRVSWVGGHANAPLRRQDASRYRGPRPGASQRVAVSKAGEMSTGQP
jgi:integrase/recombinase XerD